VNQLVSEGVVPNNAFHRLIIALQQPSAPALSEPYWPYPLPEAEMIARYGLRRLTPIEQTAFPGLHLVLQVFKARLTKPPAVMPQARGGWVVWLAETYPYRYLVRMPGGATLLAPYHDMHWTAVAADTPVTTMASARQEAQTQQWRRTLPQSVRRSLSLPDAR
jgi:hypothetical protein